VSARTDATATAALLAAACESAALTGPAALTGWAGVTGSATLTTPIRPTAAVGGWPHGLEVVRRTDGQRRFVTLINHGANGANVTIGDQLVTVPAGDVTVIQAGNPAGRSEEGIQ
jgi:hypothetical protein